MKPSHLSTPRTLSDSQFTTGHQSVRSSSKRAPSNWFFAWAGWIAFGVLLLSVAGGK